MSQDLGQLLHPADPRDVPTPGFPTHDALVEWARSKPADAVIEAALEVLRHDEWPQQYAAMALLRALGIDVEGEGHGDDFRWLVQPPGAQRLSIEPAVKGSPGLRGHQPAVELDELRHVLAEAINGLPERARIVLTLRYYERLPHNAIADVLGVDEKVVSDIQAQALLEVRRQITGRYLETLQEQLTRSAVGEAESAELTLLREAATAA